MTTTATEVTPAADVTADAGTLGDRLSAVQPAVRLVGVFAASLIVFALLLVAKGSNPIDGYRAMWSSVTRDSTAFGDVLVRLTPYLLAALAVVVPARAGMFNIGGEGQLVIGAIGAMVAGNALDQSAPRAITLLMMAVAAIALAAAWAAVAGVLRVALGVNETISTLLLNYVATFVLAWLVTGRWKDPAATGFPQTRKLTDAESLPTLFGRVHIGLIVALLAAVLVWAALKYTVWGFQLGVLGGNSEAARRAGFRTGDLAVSTLMVGGALAGLGGMLQVSGVEGSLRIGSMSGYGFTAVLAAWMVKQAPLKSIASSFLLAAIAIGGNGLKLRLGLSAASVNILMAIILLAVLGWGTKPAARRAKA